MSTAIFPTDFRPISDDPLYEVVDGRIVELPPKGAQREITAGNLHVRLATHVAGKPLGRVVAQTLFDFTTQVDCKRRPDVAFVSSERWPRSKPIPNCDGWPVVPNLAVEVVSKSNTFEEVLDKLHEYFRVGVETVWVVINPKHQVYIFDLPTKVHILGLGDELTDERLLPGFRFPLTELFEVEMSG